MSELPVQTICFMSEHSIEPAIFMSEVLSERRILMKINRYRFPAATRFTISSTAFHFFRMTGRFARIGPLLVHRNKILHGFLLQFLQNLGGSFVS